MSRFISDVADYDNQSTSKIDFDKAIELKGSGSACDIYKTRWNRRTVFVKRLKKEYRDSPLYLDALEKEYEIGVGLNHPSLPTYLAFSRDFIVLDFIDGTTLADMIKSEDPWLKEERNRKQVLSQLIESVEYLHRHNVVHCDIKADNIMISANGYNLVLLDFDKCYTDYFNDTSGDPRRFEMDVDSPGRIAMDWRGVAGIAGELESFGGIGGKKKQRKLVEACFQNEINPEELKRLIGDQSRSFGSLYLLLSAVSLVAATLFFVFLLFNRNSSQTPNVSEDNLSETERLHLPKGDSDSINKNLERGSEVSINSEPIAVSPEVLTLEAQSKAAVLDPLIEPYFAKLRTRLTRIATLKADENISKEQIIDSLRAFSDMEEEYVTESFEILNDCFPGVSEREAWRIMSRTKSYTSYKRWVEPLQRELTGYK